MYHLFARAGIVFYFFYLFIWKKALMFRCLNKTHFHFVLLLCSIEGAGHLPDPSGLHRSDVDPTTKHAECETEGRERGLGTFC